MLPLYVNVHALFSVGSLDNILYADGLPDNIEDTQLQEEFPDADMIALPMTRGKRLG